MNFGTVPYSGLQQNDFILPHNGQVYLPGRAFAEPAIHVGLSLWQHEKWKGTLYPPGTKGPDTLPFYAGVFDTVEFNASHYHVPAIAQVQKWCEKVIGNDFSFCPKYPQAITHRGPLSDASKTALTAGFLQSAAAFKEKLGPLFLQVGDHYKQSLKDDLFGYLETQSSEFTIFTELRHSSWFAGEAFMQTATTLNRLQQGWVITDTPGRRDVLHLQLTIPKAFIRFVCNGANELDMFRINEWKKLLAYWVANGLQECWFFVHVQDDAEAVDFAKYVQQEFKEILK